LQQLQDFFSFFSSAWRWHPVLPPFSLWKARHSLQFPWRAHDFEAQGQLGLSVAMMGLLGWIRKPTS
jgi:hypothetical protein